jgi:NADH:ubiquinone oxidoreductase subunit E
MHTTMTICMGSSCFARGNGENLEQIERFLAAQGEAAAISLAGCRCRGECGRGPNLEINGVLYQHVDAGTLDDLLAHTFPETKQGGTTDEHR